MKIIKVSKKLDWGIMHKKIVGTHFLNEDTIGMVFDRKDITGNSSTMRLHAENFTRVVVFTTIYRDTPVNLIDEGREEVTLNRILDSSGVNNENFKQVKISSVHCNYSVFSKVSDKHVDIMILDYQLREKGYVTTMDLGIHGALIVRIDGVTWHFFNTGKIFAIVGETGLEKSIELIEQSWGQISEKNV